MSGKEKQEQISDSQKLDILGNGMDIIIRGMAELERKIDVIGNIVYDNLVPKEAKKIIKKTNKKSGGKTSTKNTNVEAKIDGE